MTKRDNYPENKIGNGLHFMCGMHVHVPHTRSLQERFVPVLIDRKNKLPSLPLFEKRRQKYH